MRDTSRIRGGGKRSAVALSREQVHDLRAKLAANEQARTWDLLDLVDMMLATGQRIGETAAVTWDALDLDAGTAEVTGTVITSGQGAGTLRSGPARGRRLSRSERVWVKCGPDLAF